MAQSQKIDSIVVSDASQNVVAIGNNNLIEDVKMSMVIHTSAYVTGDAHLDAQLASELSAQLSTSLADQQVALLGALNSSKSAVKNLIQNSCAAEISSAQLQRCFVSAATGQSLVVVGNNNVVRHVTMDSIRDTFSQCSATGGQQATVVQKTQAWADSQAKSGQTGPLDGLFSALGNLTAGVGMIPVVIAASVAGVMLMVVYFLFSSTRGGAHGGALELLDAGRVLAADSGPAADAADADSSDSDDSDAPG